LCSSALRADTIDYIRAIVGDSVITAQQISWRISDLLERRGEQSPSSESAFQVLWNGTYQGMLRQKVVLQDYKRLEKDKGAKIPDNIVEDEVQRMIREDPRFGGDRVRFDKWLQANGITRARFRSDVRDSIIEAEMQREFVKRPIISPQKIENYYQAHQDKYTVSERMKFRWIAMQKHADDTNGAAQKKMDEVLILARSGTDFGELAKEWSERPQRDPDWLETGKVLEAYRGELQKIKPGECTGVVELADWLFIFRLDDREAAHVTPLTEVRNGIAAQLKDDEWNHRAEAWISRLRGKTLVQEF
jgi:parvulin-like peptidyl-prolyl isomerase